MAIQDRLSHYPVPEFVWEEYYIDREINDRGVLIDLDLADQAIQMDASARAELTASLKAITHLDNPNSVQQMKDWLSKHGLQTDTLGKKVVNSLIKDAPSDVAQVLSLRQQLARSSVKK